MTTSNDEQAPATSVDGIWNFRDVGEAGSAVPIRSGVLFRSSELTGLTPEGARTLRTLGVTDLYDLRSPTEIARTGTDRVDGSIRVHEVPFATPAPDGQRAPHEIAYRKIITDLATSGHAPDPEVQAEFMQSEYRRFVELPGALAALKAVSAQIASGATALVHCAAGKDRTGFLIGVVLRAVGVDYDAILADYLRSNDAIDDMRAHIGVLMQAAQPELAQLLESMLSDEILGVRPDYLHTGMARVTERFGSPQQMLEAAGIDGTELNRLRSALT